MRWLYRRLFPELLVAEVNEHLGSANYEALAEYHHFYTPGMDIAGIKKRLKQRGYERVLVDYSSALMLVQLWERTGWQSLIGLAGIARFGRLCPITTIVAHRGV